MKLMPPKHPYYPRENECKGCPYKKTTNLVFDNEKAICKACRKTDAVSVKWSRDRLREHFKKQFKGSEATWEINNVIDKLTVSYQDIKTITGKAHNYPYARNMSVYYLKPLLKQAEYLGNSPDIKENKVNGHKDETIWHYYEIPFMGQKSYLIIKEFEGSKFIHHIQDNEHFDYNKIKNKIK